jgi:tetratricopeptide (TPR) repeat protein
MARGKTARAEELLQDLISLDADRTLIEELRARLENLRREQLEEENAQRRAAEQKAKPLTRAQQEAQKKKIATLFEKANEYYQAEKYAKGLESLNELFALDPEHDEAKQLAADIEKAQELADRIREEEGRRRAEEAAFTPQGPPEPPPKPQSSGDVWGSKDVVKAEDEMGLPEVSEGLPPPKTPLSERMVDRVSHVRIPLRPILMGIGVLAVAASAYFVIDSLRQAVFPPKYSLLVLPAGGANVDSSMQFLADAITEDLIGVMSTVADLRVLAPVTSLSLKTSRGSSPQVARSLGANYFLQWSIERATDNLVFQLTLSDTSSPEPVWSTKRQSSMRELRLATGEIAHAILQAMKIEEIEALPTEMNTTGEAYEAYARGRWYLRQRGSQSVNAAIASFALAAERDARFDKAHLGLAWAHILAKEFDVDTTMHHLTVAWSHLNAALSLGARSSESHRIRGVIASYQLQFDRAVDELERGAAMAPSDAETQRRLALVYVVRGRTDDALKAAMRALSDDPRNVDSYVTLGSIQHLLEEQRRFEGKSSADEYREALQTFEQGIRYASDRSRYMSGEYADLLHYTHQPERAAKILEDRAAQTQHYTDYYRIGRLYQTIGRTKQTWEEKLESAKTQAEMTIAANPLDARAYSSLALIETRLGSFKNAGEASQRARQLAPHDIDVLYNTARMYALQTNKAQSIEYLVKAVDRRYRLSSILDMDFYNLRSEPEFQTAVTR